MTAAFNARDRDRYVTMFHPDFRWPPRFDQGRLTAIRTFADEADARSVFAGSPSS